MKHLNPQILLSREELQKKYGIPDGRFPSIKGFSEPHVWVRGLRTVLQRSDVLAYSLEQYNLRELYGHIDRDGGFIIRHESDGLGGRRFEISLNRGGYIWRRSFLGKQKDVIKYHDFCQLVDFFDQMEDPNEYFD